MLSPGARTDMQSKWNSFAVAILTAILGFIAGACLVCTALFCLGYVHGPEPDTVVLYNPDRIVRYNDTLTAVDKAALVQKKVLMK